MKTPMKIMLIVSVLCMSFLCVLGGLGMWRQGGWVFAALGLLALAALGLWPLIAKMLKRVSAIRNPGLAACTGGSVLFYIILSLATGLAVGTQTPQAFFDVLNGISIVTGSALIGVLVLGLIYWSFKQVEKGEMGPRGAFGVVMFALILTVLPISAVMEKYTPKYSSGYLAWFAWLALALLTLSLALLAWLGRQLSAGMKVRRSIAVIPYAIFASAWAVMLGQATWIFLHGRQEIGLKILVGILDPLYVLACLVIAPGLAAWLAGYQISAPSAVNPGQAFARPAGEVER